jgi:hypothetical protein
VQRCYIAVIGNVAMLKRKYAAGRRTDYSVVVVMLKTKGGRCHGMSSAPRFGPSGDHGDIIPSTSDEREEIPG